MSEPEKIAIYTRHSNAALYVKSQELSAHLPYPRIRLTDTSADGALIMMLNAPYDWVINLDDDAYLMRTDSIPQIIEYMRRNSIDYCGLPDGNRTKTRFHNPLVMNPFFNIFHLASIRKKVDVARLREHPYNMDELRSRVPIVETGPPYAYDMFEPFYPEFLVLMAYCTHCELRSTHFDKNDEYTTILYDTKDRPFLAHTWWARSYAWDPENRARIDKVILYAQEQFRLNTQPQEQEPSGN